MSNYIIEDEIRDYHPLKESNANNKFDPSKYLVIGVAILVIMIFVIIVAGRIHVRDEYSSLEIEMVKEAERYVNKYSLMGNKEIYLDADKLDIKIPDNCNIMSGVIYEEGNYIPYLYCDDYESRYLDSNSNIKLVGNNVILLAKGSKYYELGYQGEVEYQISGKVNTDEEGIYNVYYIPKQGQEYTIRKVIVVDNPNANELLPKINIDDSEATIELDQNYNEKIVAVDNKDGNITNMIIKKENVNNKEIGEYKNYYSVTNRSGYTTMAVKNVVVVASLNEDETSIITSLSNDNMTNENVIISVRIVGNLYDYTELPDKSITKEREFVYEVGESDNYLFNVYNKDGTRIYKNVKVDNIDKSSPEGSCKATLYSDRTVFSVNITSFNYIVGYNYIVDNQESGYVSNSYYSSSLVGDKEASVILRDYVGNTSTIKCETTANKYQYDPLGYRDLTYQGKPRLRIPLTEALAKKGYTVPQLNKCIYDRVVKAGPGTRYGVVEAAYGLIDCMYKMTGTVLSYNHASGKVEEENTKSGGKTNYCGGINKDICGKLGVNTNWGKQGGSCTTDTCWHGLNCATFVRWAMCNGGMDLCSRGSAGAYGMANSKYVPEADIVNVYGSEVKYVSGRDMSYYSASQLIRMIKPGDVLAHYNTRTDVNGSTQHTYVVIGIDNEGIYTANDGYYVKKIRFSNMLDGEYSYRILFLDNYYANQNNRNHLYG